VRIDRTGPASLKQGRKFFVLPETIVRWAGLVHHPSQDWLRMEWDPDQVPYLSVWVDEGMLNPESVTTLEPTTGFYDNLALAWEKTQVTMIDSGDTQSWTLTVRLGTGDHPFPAEVRHKV